ncbi:Zn(II)2Cys6 transcription factor [Colletotrichum tofieldiae]|uniref:Zn(II)2Cys6 transcription factor n=1 Tax=Colletotrichum tofieldiae TaxID=708197 RepID=A0A166X8S8_9PEZI|nr:Zn(II)2Cys6 transcription factor [Colletotrichum tofieldiae]
METTIDAAALGDCATPRQRVTNACEACRAAKVKCQTSVQPGICRRCLEFKRECVFRTGPRTRRPRQSRLNQDAPRLPPPPGPSKTFSIDFEMPQLEEPDDLENLAARHDKYFEEFLPPSDMESIDVMLGLEDPGSGPYSSISSPPSSGSGPSISVSNLGLKPQFNLDSAEKLLRTFRVMLKHFPCVVLPPDATVASLSKTKPFLLLAILSTASASNALQGHTLYDEEFRKILGLKFVVGSERTMELLQGLLIYTAWYPFHLRPKSKQAFHYVRMAAEILHDLDLNHPPYQGAGVSTPFTPDQMEGIRAYLSCYYLVTAHVLPSLQYFRKTTLTYSRFAMAWARTSLLSLPYTSWTTTCCDLLERTSALKGDHTLAWLARLLHITEEASTMTKNVPATEQAKQQAHFMFLGLDSQLRDWQNQIPRSLGDVASIKIASLFTEIFLLAGPVYRLTATSKVGDPSLGPPIPAPRLERCLMLLRSFFDFFVNLDRNAFVEISSIDWGRFIQATIVAIRLSFPLPLCPGWDHARAREQLQFDSYLAKLSAHHDELTPSTKSMDVFSASKVVFAVIKRKYEGRVANIDTPVNKLPRSIRGCPMFDGSLEPYFPIWDQDLNRDGSHGLVPPVLNGTPTVANDQPAYTDLWATMTMGWPEGMSGNLNQNIDLSQEQHTSMQLDPSFQVALNMGPSPPDSV